MDPARHHPARKREPALLFVDSLPHNCLHCEHHRVVSMGYDRDAIACKEVVQTVRDSGVSLELDEVIVRIDGGEYCECWTPMTAGKALRVCGESYVDQHHGMWG